ncbi:MAG: tetratricopeptide repeat protein [Thermoanaerobaculales bacterium]
MKKTPAVAFALIVTVGLIVGFGWMWRAGDRRAPDSTLVSATVELGLALEAPEGPDSPIFLSIGLASPRVINLLAYAGPEGLDDLPELTIGTAASPWWTEIRLVARQGEDEQELTWTLLSREAEPVADLSDGLGRSIRGVVKPGEVKLWGLVRLQAKMEWNEQVLGSNELDLDINPNSFNATRKATLLTRFYLEMGDPDDAQSWVDELVRLQPRTSTTYALRARVLEEAGDLVAAQESWVRAIELQPKDLEEPAQIYFARLRAVEERLASDATRDRSP